VTHSSLISHHASFWRTYSLFGYRLYTDFPFATPLLPADGPADLTFTCTLTAPADADWQTAVPLFQSAARLPGGESQLSLYQSAGGFLFRFAGIADFYLWPDRITCHLLDPAYDYLIEIYFLGLIMAFWLEQQSLLPLHASAVVVDGRAVAFLSSNKGGKTSLAAAFLAAGYPLLTDDILPLAQQPAGRFTGYPGYPQMRFWPDQASHFLGHYHDLPLVHPAHDKRRVAVGQPAGFGRFQPTACPLAVLYLPARTDEAGTPDIQISAVPPREAVIELLRFTFLHTAFTLPAQQTHRFNFLTHFVQHIPLRRLHYPSGWHHLPAVVSRIRQDIAEEGNSRNS
jgi:hypothetical protein